MAKTSKATNGHPSVARFRRLKERRRLTTVEVHGETFAFRLGLSTQGQARRNGEPDPVVAMGRLSIAITRILAGLSTSPAIQHLLEVGTSMAHLPEDITSEMRYAIALRALARAGMLALPEKEESEEGESEEGEEKGDDRSVATLYTAVLSEIAGHAGQAIVAGLTGQTLDDAYTVLLWGLREGMPDLTYDDLEDVVGLADLPGVLMQVVSVLLERQSPNRVDDSAKTIDEVLEETVDAEKKP